MEYTNSGISRQYPSKCTLTGICRRTNWNEQNKEEGWEAEIYNRGGDAGLSESKCLARAPAWSQWCQNRDTDFLKATYKNTGAEFSCVVNTIAKVTVPKWRQAQGVCRSPDGGYPFWRPVSWPLARCKSYCITLRGCLGFARGRSGNSCQIFSNVAHSGFNGPSSRRRGPGQLSIQQSGIHQRAHWSCYIKEGTRANIQRDNHGMNNGRRQFSDTTHTFSNVPTSVQGWTYVKDRRSSGIVSFDVEVKPLPSKVYVIVSNGNTGASKASLASSLRRKGWNTDSTMQSTLRNMRTSSFPNARGFQVWSKTAVQDKVTVDIRHSIQLTVMVGKKMCAPRQSEEIAAVQKLSPKRSLLSLPEVPPATTMVQMGAEPYDCKIKQIKAKSWILPHTRIRAVPRPDVRGEYANKWASLCVNLPPARYTNHQAMQVYRCATNTPSQNGIFQFQEELQHPGFFTMINPHRNVCMAPDKNAIGGVIRPTSCDVTGRALQNLLWKTKKGKGASQFVHAETNLCMEIEGDVAVYHGGGVSRSSARVPNQPNWNDCEREVRARHPNADGVTYFTNSHNCLALMGFQRVVSSHSLRFGYTGRIPAPGTGLSSFSFSGLTGEAATCNGVFHLHASAPIWNHRWHYVNNRGCGLAWWQWDRYDSNGRKGWVLHMRGKALAFTWRSGHADGVSHSAEPPTNAQWYGGGSGIKDASRVTWRQAQGVCRSPDGGYPFWRPVNWPLSRCKSYCITLRGCLGFARSGSGNSCQIFSKGPHSGFNGPSSRRRGPGQLSIQQSSIHQRAHWSCYIKEWVPVSIRVEKCVNCGGTATGKRLILTRCTGPPRSTRVSPGQKWQFAPVRNTPGLNGQRVPTPRDEEE